VRSIDTIVIHCSASANGRSVTASTIDWWHAQRGFRRSAPWRAAHNPHLTAIGYHWVIDVDGIAATGRHIDEIGAHAIGHNANSIGICMVGENAFTAAQWESMRNLICSLAWLLAERAGRAIAQESVPGSAQAIEMLREIGVRVLGHRDLPDVKKTCPGFDVGAWLLHGMQPPIGHLLTSEDNHD
jgi:hypothetical protein